MSHEHFKYVNIEKWREVRRESACVFVERSRTTRISIRMGWEHMVSEANAEKDSCFELEQVRYILQSARKCTCADTARKQKHRLEGSCSCLWCVLNKGHGSHEPCVRRHRFCMQDKLNISVFVPSSVGGFEKTGQIRLPCVFVALLRCAHTLTCIIRGLHLHVHLHLHVKRAVLLSSMHCATMPKISQKIFCRTLIWKMHGLVFTTRVEPVFLCSCICT